MIRYRFTTALGSKVGAWRSSHADALRDAVDADMAEYDDAAPGGVRLDLLVDIEDDADQRQLSEHEFWACAMDVDKHHGAHAPLHVAERIGASVLSGDRSAIQTWKAIAVRLDQLHRKQSEPS